MNEQIPLKFVNVSTDANKQIKTKKKQISLQDQFAKNIEPKNGTDTRASSANSSFSLRSELENEGVLNGQTHQSSSS